MRNESLEGFHLQNFHQCFQIITCDITNVLAFHRNLFSTLRFQCSICARGLHFGCDIINVFVMSFA